jgi:2-amino-4-hydroxy-6-hydroxymethyldihydropteridine diphosphokinase
MKPVPVLVGLGANLDEPRDRLEEALARLVPFIQDLRVSGLYRTQPVGVADQPDFYNAVASGVTALSAQGLLRTLLRLERVMGRVRGVRFGPRRIDLDLLDYGGCIIDRERLRLPHPRMTERAFVLEPLAELAPEWRHPVSGLGAGEILAAGGPWERVERVGELGGWPESGVSR